MAQRVNAKASAYSYNSVKQLLETHQKILEELSKGITELRGTVGEGKDFDSEGVNKLVKGLLDTYEKKVYKALQESFKASETALGKMQTMIITEDVFKE
ncbi:MAG: hypothetical protein SO445_10810 [Lachnospiraceae bacterium]|nr:hypothetical protein [Lachnospiraceae bacterium]MDD7378894.1 hypothetical protein [Lachnospiraceae bacterium]MDY4618176.1 hypothetical protein [Lachnospiraceae bacterium]